MGKRGGERKGGMNRGTKVGDGVLLRTNELLDAADISMLRLRWDGPFKATTCPSPDAN